MTWARCDDETHIKKPKSEMGQGQGSDWSFLVFPNVYMRKQASEDKTHRKTKGVGVRGKRERKIVVDVTYLTQFCHLMLMKHTNQPAYIGTLRAGKGKGDLRARGANQVRRVLFSRSAKHSQANR